MTGAITGRTFLTIAKYSSRTGGKIVYAFWCPEGFIVLYMVVAVLIAILKG